MSSRPQIYSMNRHNEYFVPRDGIEREVIQADICRYLGNDALVRPGTYEDTETNQVIQGYYIVGYRNLTTAMIEDLQEASRQWALERSRMSNTAYSDSTTHRMIQEHRQQGPPPGQYQDRQPQQSSYDPRYGGQQQQYPPSGGQGNYSYQQQQQQQPPPPQQQATYSPPPNRMEPYPPPQAQYAQGQEAPYQPGSDFRNRVPYSEPQPQDARGFQGPPRVPSSSAPQSQGGYPAPAPDQQYYSSGPSQPNQGGFVPSAQVQPQDPFYGRSGQGQYPPSSDAPRQGHYPPSSDAPRQQYPPATGSPRYEERNVTPTSAGAGAPPPGVQRREPERDTYQPRR